MKVNKILKRSPKVTKIVTCNLTAKCYKGEMKPIPFDQVQIPPEVLLQVQLDLIVDDAVTIIHDKRVYLFFRSGDPKNPRVLTQRCSTKEEGVRIVSQYMRELEAQPTGLWVT